MLRVVPITLTRAAKRWVDRLYLGTINTWDLLKNAFIQRYCHPSKMAKQLEEIHYFKQEGLTTRRVSYDSSGGIAAITSKLDSLRRDMKKLKENVYAIQLGCKNFKGDHPNKECPLHEEAKNVEEVKYGVFGQTFINKRGNVGSSKKALRHIKKGHDEIIRNLESKVKALTGEVEGRAIRTKIGEYKAIFTKEGLPLYTTFYYSPKEIKYFFANSSFSDEDVQEKAKEVEEIEKVAAHHEPAHQKVTPSDLPIVSYYVAPYELSILFLRHLEQHTEEALIHYAMESLKRVKVNRPLLKEIRQTNDHAKHIKNLIVNKSRTSENEDININTRCSTIL
nr:hypothetical protein [Tanacetum cinerariifolium]